MTVLNATPFQASLPRMVLLHLFCELHPVFSVLGKDVTVSAAGLDAPPPPTIQPGGILGLLNTLPVPGTVIPPLSASLRFIRMTLLVKTKFRFQV